MRVNCFPEAAAPQPLCVIESLAAQLDLQVRARLFDGVQLEFEPRPESLEVATVETAAGDLVVVGLVTVNSTRYTLPDWKKASAALAH